MRVTIGALIASLAIAGAATAGEHPEHPKANTKPNTGPHALDGKVFVGELVKSGETAGDQDNLVFKKGKFVSTACEKYGFHHAAYTAVEKDGLTTFTASATNDQNETMSWTGTVRDGALEGTAVRKAAGVETTYTFKGKLGAPSESTEHPEHPK